MMFNPINIFSCCFLIYARLRVSFGQNVWDNNTDYGYDFVDWEEVPNARTATESNNRNNDLSHTDITETRLIESILSGYNPRARPPETDLPPSFSVLVTNLLSVDSYTHIVTVFAQILLIYKDGRLRWDNTKYSNITNVMVDIDDVWFPPFVQIGAGKVSRLGFDKMKGLVQSEGIVMWRIDDVFSFPCNLKVSAFPFDRHACNLTFHATTVVPMLKFTCDDRLEWYFKLLVPNPEWDIIYSACKFPEHGMELTVEIGIERKPWFHVVNLFAPIICLTVMNSFTFLVPVEAGDRIGLCVTIFLAFTVFISFIATTVPTSSDNVAYISYVLVVQSVISILTLFVNILIVNKHHNAKPLFSKTWLSCLRMRDYHHDNNEDKKDLTGKLLDVNDRHKADPEVSDSVGQNVSERKFDVLCFVITLVASLVPFIVYLIVVLT